MLFNLKTIKKLLNTYNIKITGTLHIGAHQCEELYLYKKLGLTMDDMIWIEANEDKVKKMKKKEIKNVYNHLITDKDDQDVVFNVSNNIMSSSILELGTHKVEHPEVYYTNKLILKSIKIDTFINRNNINIQKYNFWIMDIQGTELIALKGALESIKYAKVLCLEVNEKELYINCPLINELDDFLLNLNFKRIYTHMTINGWGDALYVNLS